MLPKLPRDAGDRNRTSPFAFTGNKFEFRAIGSSQSIAGANTVLNAIVAESLDYIATRLEAAVDADQDFNNAVQELLSEMVGEFEPILFDGDNYCLKWQKEAQRRGLPNLQTTVDCVPLATSPEAIELFGKYCVYSERELRSREEILLSNYARSIGIEAQTASTMAHTMILPVALRYQADVAAAVNNVKVAGLENPTQMDLLRELTEAASAFRKAAVALDQAVVEDIGGDALAQAKYQRDAVIPAMDELRLWGDKLELLVADDYWPLAPYREILFIR